MQLARAAAARTLTNWAKPEQPPASAPQSIPTAAPQSDPETAPQSNPAPTRHAAGHPTSTASYKQIDPAVLFTRFAAVVRDCIALETRLTAGAGPTSRAVTLQLRADPRRAPAREAFDQAIKNHPDRAILLRETTSRLDEELTADADQTLGAGNFFFAICHELGIEIDLAILPDELLLSYVDTTARAEAETNVPYPRATSPP
jgi:hypothetical protein